MAEVLEKPPGIFRRVGPRIGFGLEMTELILPESYVKSIFPYPLNNPGTVAPCS
jgi:hypothetical protein